MGDFPDYTVKRREDLIEVVLPWLKECHVREVQVSTLAVPQAVSAAMNSVLSRSKRHTFQEVKALKHRGQIESIAAHCLQFNGDLVLELGAGQGILGQTISLASKRPLVAIDRRGNTDAFDDWEHGDMHRVQADISDAFNLSIPELAGAKEIAVVAKHLCGHGSDEALTVAMNLGEKLGLLCLAPCCHVTMKWDRLCSDTKQWLSNAGFPGGMQEFDLLIDALRLARGGPKACSKWHLRDAVTPEEMEFLGRKVCRVLDEARMARLESHGFRVAALEYCRKEISPDNVLLVAVGHASTANLLLSEKPLSSISQLNCLLVEVDPAAPPSLTERLAAHFLALKASEVLCVASVSMDALAGCSKNALFCTTCDQGRLHQLMQHLVKDAILQRVVARFLPLRDCVERDMSQLLTAVVDQLHSISVSDGKCCQLRVVAKPKKLEQMICQSLPPDLLSPTSFTHVLSVAETLDAFTFAVTPRGILDPSAWSEACKGQHERAFLRFEEVIARFPKRIKEKTAVALWTDLTRQHTKLFLLQCTGLPVASFTCHSTSGWAGAPSTDQVKLESLRGQWFPSSVGAQSAAADLLLVDISNTEKEAIAALRQFIDMMLSASSPLVACHGTAILRLRCGRRPNGVKKWLREMVKHLESFSFCRIELLHLLVDRENERTAIFDWITPPGPQLQSEKPKGNGEGGY